MQSFLTAETQSVMRDAFEATKTNNYPPDLYAIAFQETKTSYCSADIKENKKDNDAFIDKMNPNPAEYRFVMQSWRNPNVLKNLRLGCKFTHGSSGVILFAKKSLSIENQGRFKSDDKLNNEKGFSAVWIKLKDKMICWGTSHSPPGKKLADKKRYPAFKKYSGFFDNFDKKHRGNTPPKKSCDVKFYAGDFNWRNGEWNDESGWSSPHFADAAVQKFYETLTPGFQNSVIQPGTKPLEVPKILDEFNEKMDMVIAARPPLSKWSEGSSIYHNSMTKEETPRTYPTFQPISTKKCENNKNDHGPATEPGEISPDEDTDDTDDTDVDEEGTASDVPMFYQNYSNEMDAFGDKMRNMKTKLITSALNGNFASRNKGKSQICLPTKEKFHCGKYEICFTGNRPLAYADSIFHRNAQATAYGPLIQPVPSDHFPVVGAYVM